MDIEQAITRAAYLGAQDAIRAAGLDIRNADGTLLVSMFEASKRLGCSETYVRDHLVARGELDTVKLGRGRKVTVASLERLVERRTANAERDWRLRSVS